MNKYLIIFILTLLSATLLAQENYVSTISLKPEKLTKTSQHLGFVEPFQKITIRSRSEGFVKSSKVKEGDFFKKGQIIANVGTEYASIKLNKQKILLEQSLIEILSQKSAYENALLDYKQSKTDLAFTQSRLHREQELEKESLSTAELLEQVTTETASKKLQTEKRRLALNGVESISSLSKLKAKIEKHFKSKGDIRKLHFTISNVGYLPLERAKANFNWQREDYLLSIEDYQKTIIKSPINGFVVTKRIENGELVNPGTSIMEMSEIHNLFVVFSVPETQVRYMKAGKKALINFDSFPAESIEAAIHDVALEATENNGSYKVKVLVKNQALKYKPGMAARIKVVDFEKENQILVPLNAITDGSNGEKIVFLAQDGKAVLQKIITGDTIDTKAQVLRGLTAGMQLIVKGQQFLKPGEVLKISTN